MEIRHWTGTDGDSSLINTSGISGCERSDEIAQAQAEFAKILSKSRKWAAGQNSKEVLGPGNGKNNGQRQVVSPVLSQIDVYP